MVLVPASIRRGEAISLRRTCRNEGGTAIRIDRFATSCECTKAFAEPKVVAAGEAFTLFVEADLSREPDFTGDLSLAIDGYSGRSVQPTFLATLELAVLPVPATTPSGNR